MALTVHHLLLTRFNIRAAGAGYTPAQPPHWLEHRLNLFECYCAPSVAQQTEDDFDWVIFCDDGTHHSVLDRIRSADGRIRIALVPKQEREGHPQELLARHHARPHADVVVSTRLDNDDLLARGALRRVREHLASFIAAGQRRWIYNPCLGYKYDLVARRLFTTSMPNSPFFSMFERPDNAMPAIGALSGNHSRMREHYPTYQDEGARSWIQVLHGENARNRIRRGDEPVALETAGEDFGTVL